MKEKNDILFYLDANSLCASTMSCENVSNNKQVHGTKSEASSSFNITMTHCICYENRCDVKCLSDKNNYCIEALALCLHAIIYLEYISKHTNMYHTKKKEKQTIYVAYDESM